VQYAIQAREDAERLREGKPVAFQPNWRPT
jgi:hypothetical protein